MNRTSYVPSFNPRRASAVERIAHELRAQALASEEGAYIGSEEGLSTQFSVSPPTLRQAARLLEHEGVLKVKRGAHGGYFADRPKMEAITRVGATYLRASANSLRDMGLVLEALTPLIVKSVIESQRLNEIEEFILANSTQKAPQNNAEIEDQFVRLLMDLTENSVLQLIHAIVYQFGLTVPRRAGPADDKLVRALWNARMGMARALVAKDAEAAIDHAMERRQLISFGIERAMQANAPHSSPATAGFDI